MSINAIVAIGLGLLLIGYGVVQIVKTIKKNRKKEYVPDEWDNWHNEQ
ncbi:MAG: hypothetical protein SLAVMIC_00247 [uncultured marine phage]|uniref:Uncharacterized protein n=1 Tax=uncultured marine phage TaxID=707152 RepID=A0A8D9CCQ7_9VIRU|nr:MAG: hypothetical protein SLAVMIC_00247 [uncultured marine phage]